MHFRKKPIAIEAFRWFKNGDHPDDRVGEIIADPMYPNDRSKDYERLEGRVVRFFRRPEPTYSGELVHEFSTCGHTWHDHGWIDTPDGDGGIPVCPGDWIITRANGKFEPCNPEIFEQTYEPV